MPWWRDVDRPSRFSTKSTHTTTSVRASRVRHGANFWIEVPQRHHEGMSPTVRGSNVSALRGAQRHSDLRAAYRRNRFSDRSPLLLPAACSGYQVSDAGPKARSRRHRRHGIENMSLSSATARRSSKTQRTSASALPVKAFHGSIGLRQQTLRQRPTPQCLAR